MKKPNKSTVNHGIVFALYIGGMFLAIVGVGILFRMILVGVRPESVILGQVFVGITWTFSWILRGLYISNRDLSINDMGKVTLGKYIGEMEQVYLNKFGENYEL